MTSQADATEVLVVPSEEMTDVQRSAVIDVCIAAHDSEDFRNLFGYFPSGARHFLAYAGSHLVSHAVVSTRWAQPEGHPILRTAYVDAVSTHPDFQLRGYASAVMRRLGAEIDDYEIGCLETDRMTFYERFGWQVWRGPLAGRSGDGLIPTPDQQGVMVLQLRRTPALDLDKGMTIECQTHPSLPGRIW